MNGSPLRKLAHIFVAPGLPFTDFSSEENSNTTDGPVNVDVSKKQHLMPTCKGVSISLTAWSTQPGMENSMPIKKHKLSRTRYQGIFKDGPNRYLVRVTWIDYKTGKRRKKERVTKSLEEALQTKGTLREWAPTTKITRVKFSDFAEDWLVVQSKLLSPSTQRRYVETVAHLNVGFGDYYLDAIEPEDFEQWRSDLISEYANSTINGWHRVLRQILEAGVRKANLPRNPARLVKTLPEKVTRGPRGMIYSPAQLKHFLETLDKLKHEGAIQEDVARMIVALSWTGLRVGELLAVRVDDIIDGELSIERSVWNRQEKSTKTDDPRRVTIVEPLQKVIAEQRQWLMSTQHPGIVSNLLFPASPKAARIGAARRDSSETSWYRTGSVMNKALKRVCTEADLPRISPQGLRRTWENSMRRAGVDQLVRRSMNGWRSNKAQAIYSQVSAQEREEAANAVFKMVKG